VSLNLYPKPKRTTDLWALVAIDHKGWPALIEYDPVDWWDEMLMGDGFVDVFGANLPEKAGVYRWYGNYVPNINVGRHMSNGEVDDWPGKWVGYWIKEEIDK